MVGCRSEEILRGSGHPPRYRASFASGRTYLGGWVIGWLVGWLVDWLVGWWVGRLVDFLVG